MVAILTSELTLRLLPLFFLNILLICMSDSEFSDTSGANQTPQAGHTTHMVSTQAQINELAGGLSNTNVDGTVGPNFFVARLNDEAMTLALYGWLRSDNCCLGLQGKVQLELCAPVEDSR